MRIFLRTIATLSERRPAVHTMIRCLGIFSYESVDYAVLRNNQLGVRYCGRIPEEEGFSVLDRIFEELESFFMDKFWNIRSLPVRDRVHIVFQFNSFRVMPDVARIVAVGEKLAIEAIELIDALVCRISGCADVAKSPFTERSGSVAGLSHVMEDRLGSVRKRKLSFRIKFEVATYRGMPAVRACQQTRAGRGTDSCPRITLCKTHSALCQLIDVGRLELFLSVTT